VVELVVPALIFLQAGPPGVTEWQLIKELRGLVEGLGIIGLLALAAILPGTGRFVRKAELDAANKRTERAEEREETWKQLALRGDMVSRRQADTMEVVTKVLEDPK
jgi:hypothetical protein